MSRRIVCVYAEMLNPHALLLVCACIKDAHECLQFVPQVLFGCDKKIGAKRAARFDEKKGWMRRISSSGSASRLGNRFIAARLAGIELMRYFWTHRLCLCILSI